MNIPSPDSQSKPVVAFAMTLLAGLWMLASGVSAVQGYHMGSSVDMHWYGYAIGWMWHHHMMAGYGPGYLWPWASLIVGLVLVRAAGFIYSNPRQTRGWGVVSVVASCVAMLAGAGGIFGAGLGIIGGLLAVGWRA